jgi:hypothetical protein
LAYSNLEKSNVEVEKLELDHKEEVETLLKERKVLEDVQLKLESEVGTLR